MDVRASISMAASGLAQRLRDWVVRRVEIRLREEDNRLGWFGWLSLLISVPPTAIPWLYLLMWGRSSELGFVQFYASGGVILLVATSPVWATSMVIRTHQRRIQRRSTHQNRLTTADVLLANKKMDVASHDEYVRDLRRFMSGRA